MPFPRNFINLRLRMYLSSTVITYAAKYGRKDETTMHYVEIAKESISTINDVWWSKVNSNAKKSLVLGLISNPRGATYLHMAFLHRPTAMA